MIQMKRSLLHTPDLCNHQIRYKNMLREKQLEKKGMVNSEREFLLYFLKFSG